MEGFDTGFVTFARAWDQLRPSDLGNLWEHLVLDVLLAGIGPDRVRFWRDKLKREVDFLVSPQPEPPMIRTRGLFEVVFCNLNDLEVTLKEASPPPR